MDFWLTNEIKELLAQPCLDVSKYVGNRLNDRLKRSENIDERALTEDILDLLDTSSGSNVWGTVLPLLNARGIYLSTNVQKSTKEYENGADIGIVLNRNVNKNSYASQNQYACLIQCKKIDNSGAITDFFHEVGASKTKQSSLLLDITPSSFYFIYVPTIMLQIYGSIEPIFFLQTGECSSPIWNMGHFEYESPVVSALNETLKASAAGILVIPALAVESHRNKSKRIELKELLPNCIPFWYWFAELLIPAFIGDRLETTITVASNGKSIQNTFPDFGVRFTLKVDLGTG